MQDPRYFDRDLSWLSFNYRVLMEAQDPTLPLYERIKFLAIYSSNMGEFFRVRVGYMQSLIKIKQKNPTKLKFDPDRVLELIFQEVHRQQGIYRSTFLQQIIPELHKHRVQLVLGEPEEEIHQNYIKQFFEEEVKAYLHPELLQKEKIKTFLREGALYLAVRLRAKPPGYEEMSYIELRRKLAKKKNEYAVIQIPTHYFPRFVELPKIGDDYFYMFLDDVIKSNLSKIFPGYEVLCCHSLKLNRNADLLIEDEFSGDLVEKIKKSLKKRRIGIPARFLYDQDMPRSMVKYLRETFQIRKREEMSGGTYHSLKDLFGFPNPIGPSLERMPTPPVRNKVLDGYNNIFEPIRERNRLLHYPYESYDYTIGFLNQAAADPKVTEIYATQYRVASNSGIVAALVRAAQNGKKVTVFVEIKARFDESSNLDSARDMREAGVKTVYSIPGLKVHAKVALVLRQEAEGERGYAFLSTGNFNEKTARLYTDYGMFTSENGIISELKELFKHLQDQSYEPKPFKNILVAQFNMRKVLYDRINMEIERAKRGELGGIFIKVNNLEDKRMIEKLYEASQAGVRIRMIVRGICCLRPGIEGLSENIHVIRIVDQFLEHPRIVTFLNGGDYEVFMGSADLMKRNLSRRIEVFFPVKHPEDRDRVILDMETQWSDNVKACRLDANITNHRIQNDFPPCRSQHVIYERAVKDSQESVEI
ncbi:polyphosphate kinase 1 [Pontibacter sp. G13]|uniref:polyphosphate kinase 1 n=1 Tax=Pontibacter sp. G13 TaxID=3074898 RepID=UPI00288BE5EB|nr:polyphosphate kinase 1 [Pontibacter sp. G13]WNJ21482.1 polyphosphate kinase 1 [Pontibacter sp. G13]